MSKNEREFLRIQLLETQRMIELVGDHPIMSFSLKQKERDLIEQLEKNTDDLNENQDQQPTKD